MQTIRVGRDEFNDVVVNDPQVSRNHCSFTLDDQGNYTIMDEGSTNGTYVNGSCIGRRMPIRLNRTDIVRIGNTTVPWLNFAWASRYTNPPVAEHGESENRPCNLLPWAIIATLLCCVPFGIVSIVYSTQANTYWNSAKYEKARSSHRTALTWLLVAIGVNILFWIVYTILVAMGISTLEWLSYL